MCFGLNGHPKKTDALTARVWVLYKYSKKLLLTGAVGQNKTGVCGLEMKSSPS
jgi:hypothetical protein